MERLKRRSDFRAAAGGARAPGRSFVVQARRRADDGPARFGLTVSKQVGNAVQRNRVRRRLREIVKLSGPRLYGGHDYVLIGRRAALQAPFDDMRRELDAALDRIHASERGATGGSGRRTLHDPNIVPHAVAKAKPKAAPNAGPSDTPTSNHEPSRDF